MKRNISNLDINEDDRNSVIELSVSTSTSCISKINDHSVKKYRPSQSDFMLKQLGDFVLVRKLPSDSLSNVALFVCRHIFTHKYFILKVMRKIYP